MNKLTAEKCREQFEEWWQEHQHNGNPPRFGWDHYRDGETYSDDELQTLWEVWKGSREALEIALPVMEQRERGEGWIEWGGDGIPVDDNVFVEVKWRNGAVLADIADAFAWYHDGFDNDIIAYRIIPENSDEN